MKKAVAAGVLMLLMFAASLWNIRYLDNFTDTLAQEIRLSRDYCRAAEYDAADSSLRRAMALWEGAEGYTHIFIRHAEIDAVTDAFYDILSLINAENKEEADGVYGRLLSHVQSIDEMEHISIGSVF